MRKLLTALAIAGTMISAGMPGVASAETLRVGATCTYFPFNYREPNGQIAGYDIDVVSEVAERIGAEIEYVCQPFDGLIPALLGNKFDAIASSMSITPARMEQIDFTIPYRISVGRFVGRADQGLELFSEDGTINEAGFEGITVGIPRASTYEAWIKAKIPEAEILLYDGPDPMFLDLENGRVDVIMTSPMSAHLNFLSQESGREFTFLGPPLEDEKFFGVGVGIGVRKGNPELVEQMNDALKSMTEDGTLKEFSLKYFPFAIHPEEWSELPG